MRWNEPDFTEARFYPLHSRRVGSLYLATALATILLSLNPAFMSPARADGGAGGRGGAPGGIDSPTGAGGNGGADSGINCHGGGGGAGQTGGQGGACSGGSGGAGGAAPGEYGADAGYGNGKGGGGGAHGFVGDELPISAATGGFGGSGGGTFVDVAGGGGAGGYGAVITGSGDLGALGYVVSGGDGGSGGFANTWGGEGGSGGIGLLLTTSGAVTATVNSNVRGGNGGAGGDSATWGGKGGDGGAGLKITTPSEVNLVVNGSVRGGNGGSGGSIYYGGNGGNAGAGLLVTSSAAGTVTINGAVAGGNGSTGGKPYPPSELAGSNGAPGNGGVGLSGQNLIVVIGAGGSVTGGLGGDGVTRANAITFTGGANTLRFANTTAALTGNINVAGSLTFDQSNSTTIANSITGTGALVKSGAGTITLSGTNSYSGATIVAAGKLDVEGSIASSSLTTAQSGGILTGTGIIGSTKIETGGVLAGMQGRRLTVDGDLTLMSGSAVNVALGGVSSTALFDVSGDLTLGGTLNVSDQGGFGAGIYRLFHYGGNLLGDGMTINSTPDGVAADNLLVETSVAGQVNLVSSAGVELAFWDGGNTTLHGNDVIDGGSGIWSADGRNWTTADGSLNGPLQPNPTYAIFQGAAGTVTVDDSAGAIGVTGMQFGTDGYNVKGEAVTLQSVGGKSIIRVGDGTAAGLGMTATIASELTGASKLIKTDYGTLILDGDNSYTGGTEIGSGTLQVSRDANLGDTAGDLTFAGGTLTTTGTFDTSRLIALTLDGRFDVAANTELGLTGTLSGSGDLVKSGDGSLRLDNTANAYGNTLVQAGTLIGNAGSISGTIGNAATVVFDQASDGSFAGNIAALNGTRGLMIKRGAGNLTLAGTSMLDWSVEAGGLTTAAERFGGNATLDAGASLTFDQIANASYAGVLSGSGAFAKTGAGLLELSGDSGAFTGTTSVAAGTLAVNGWLGGTLDVRAGGRLQGTGTVGNTLVSGTIAPGNSIGTLSVAGDITFTTGSVFEVEANAAGDADRINATGTAMIAGGTVKVLAGAGKYVPTTRYTILSAGGGRSGVFSGLTSNLAFLTPELSYDLNDVYLTLTRNSVDFAAMAASGNQRAAAGGVGSLGMDNALFEAFLNLPDDDHLIQTSLDRLSGEVHAAVPGVLLADSHVLRDAISQRIAAAFGGVSSVTVPVMAYGQDGIELAPATTERFALWGQAFGAWGRVEGDGNAVGAGRSLGGVLAGGDAAIDDTWRLGLLAGYSRDRFDSNDRAASGTSDNYHLGLYGGGRWGGFGLSGGAVYSWSHIDTARAVAFPGFADSLGARYDAGTAQVFSEAAYRIDTATASFEPFANLAYVNVRTGGFTEKGGAAALHATSATTDATFTTLGLRAQADIALAGIDASARGLLGWRHAFGDLKPTTALAFAGGDSFTVAGAPLARDAAVIETGLDFRLSPTATLGLAYAGQLSSRAHDNGFKVDLNVRF